MRRHAARCASLLVLVLAGVLFASCGPGADSSLTAPAAETEPLAGQYNADVPPPRPTPSVSISPEQVREIAEAFLPSFREQVRVSSGSSPCADDPSAMCPHEGYPKFGFNNKQELEMATVGTPAEAFMLWPAALKGFQPGQALEALVTPTHSWQVPVTVNGEGRNMIEVGWTDGRWEVAGCCEEPSTSRNLTAVQQQYAGRSTPVKTIFVPEGIHLAWITEDEHDRLSLLREPPPYYPTLKEKVMKPYPASEFLTELAKALSSE